MNIPSSIVTLLVGIVVTLVSIWYGQNHGLMPTAASTESILIDGLFNTMMTIGCGLFLIVQGTLIIAAVRFRRRPDDQTDGPPIEGNIPLEILWTSIPAVIVLGLAVYSFEVYSSIGGLNLDPSAHGMAHSGHASHQVAQMPGSAMAAPMSVDTAPSSSDSASATSVSFESSELVVQAAGLQYAWIFTYPDTGVVAGELHVPVGRTVKLEITANDVLHAFWVPEFRLKQDAIPGTPTELRFTPNTVGQYPVICAELCGPYHGAMKTTVLAETPEDFQAWMASQQELAQANQLQDAIAVRSAEPSPSQFLSPFIDDLGITPATLEALQPHHTAM